MEDIRGNLGRTSRAASRWKIELPPFDAVTYLDSKRTKERARLPLGRSSWGPYIPPIKLPQMMRDVQDESSKEYQRLTWYWLRKSITGLVNKVNASNTRNIVRELFSENLLRGRGLFARVCMKSQLASPEFTYIFAAVVGAVNTKFPEIGQLLLKRIILQLRRAHERNDKPVILAATKFIAHLLHQRVAHEMIVLQLSVLLLHKPSKGSVEAVVGLVKECGAALQNLYPEGLHRIFQRFRGILNEGQIDMDKRALQLMILAVFALRRTNFEVGQAVLPELDLVGMHGHQLPHNLHVDGELDGEAYLDVFRIDPDFLENEKKYEVMKKDILVQYESEDEFEERLGNGGEGDEWPISEMFHSDDFQTDNWATYLDTYEYADEECCCRYCQPI